MLMTMLFRTSREKSDYKQKLMSKQKNLDYTTELSLILINWFHGINMT